MNEDFLHHLQVDEDFHVVWDENYFSINWWRCNDRTNYLRIDNNMKLHLCETKCYIPSPPISWYIRVSTRTLNNIICCFGAVSDNSGYCRFDVTVTSVLKTEEKNIVATKLFYSVMYLVQKIKAVLRIQWTWTLYYKGNWWDHNLLLIFNLINNLFWLSTLLQYILLRNSHNLGNQKRSRKSVHQHSAACRTLFRLLLMIILALLRQLSQKNTCTQNLSDALIVLFLHINV